MEARAAAQHADTPAVDLFLGHFSVDHLLRYTCGSTAGYSMMLFHSCRHEIGLPYHIPPPVSSTLAQPFTKNVAPDLAP